MNHEQEAELVNLYHLARTALSGGDDSRNARINWAAKEFVKVHPEVSEKRAYLELCDNLLVWK